MISVSLLLVFLFAHFLGDFAFQTDWMASNKSTMLSALFWHVFVYEIISFLVIVLFIGLYHSNISIWMLIRWCALNASAHLIVDMITSTISYWFGTDEHSGERNKIFWVVLGADQMIHGATLVMAALCMGFTSF